MKIYNGVKRIGVMSKNFSTLINSEGQVVTRDAMEWKFYGIKFGKCFLGLTVRTK